MKDLEEQRLMGDNQEHEHDYGHDAEHEYDHDVGHDRDDQISNEKTEQTERLLEEDPMASASFRDDAYNAGVLPSLRDVDWKGSILALAMLLLLISGFVVVSRKTHSDDLDISNKTGFRRSPEDYILKSDWDYAAKATTRYQKWVIRDMEVNPDGVFRPMILINGTFPGPLIECNEGDTLIIDVENNGLNATSIHWHGIYQNGTNWMDGTVGITQCPIAPGGSFRYEFTVNGQSGTYWYHAHQATQASDGLAGPLIVHSKDELSLQKVEYSTDRVMMFQDYYHDLTSSLLPHYLASNNENAEPVPDGALLNGQNIRNCDSLPHRKCDNSTASMPLLDLQMGQNHRLRIINIGAFAEFQIGIDEHEFAVTEVDGTNVLPSYYHRLNINPAQRYSIVVSTNLTTTDSFWLRARMVTACFAEPNPDMEPEVRAILRYTDGHSHTTKRHEEHESEPITLPTTQDWSEVVELICKDMNTTELIPIPAIAAPSKADAFYYFRSNFQIGGYQLSRGFFNESSFRPNLHSPTLQRYIDGFQESNATFINSTDGINTQAFHTPRELVVQSTGIKTIDILLDNFDDGNHPMHLHGYKFFILAQGHGAFNYSTYPDIDVSNPLRRDTASLESYGWLLIRFVADNPGAWAFHCHISWHSEAGLLMQFVTQPEVMATWELPEANTRLCEAPGIERGGGFEDEFFQSWKPDGGH
jgi:FtsP/CotA-like multicopper oxidase with cupredoxin domain